MFFSMNGNPNQKQFNLSIIIWVAITTLLCIISLRRQHNEVNVAQKVTESERRLIEKEVENRFLNAQIDSLKNDVKTIELVKQKIYYKYEEKKNHVANLPVDSAIIFFSRELP